jgi:hypothetical protein
MSHTTALAGVRDRARKAPTVCADCAALVTAVGPGRHVLIAALLLVLPIVSLSLMLVERQRTVSTLTLHKAAVPLAHRREALVEMLLRNNGRTASRRHSSSGRVSVTLRNG